MRAINAAGLITQTTLQSTAMPLLYFHFACVDEIGNIPVKDAHLADTFPGSYQGTTPPFPCNKLCRRLPRADRPKRASQVSRSPSAAAGDFIQHHKSLHVYARCNCKASSNRNQTG